VQKYPVSAFQEAATLKAGHLERRLGVIACCWRNPMCKRDHLRRFEGRAGQRRHDLGFVPSQILHQLGRRVTLAIDMQLIALDD
jgi:hypothetical protein